VPQLYLGMPDVAEDVPQPPRQLKGFSSVDLAPGQTKRVSFPLDERAFSYWDARAHGWRVKAGCYKVEVGFSSRDLPLQGTIGRGAGCDAGLVLPARRGACTTSRVVTITLPRRMRSARVTYAGRKAVVTRRRGLLRARIDLRRVPAGRVTVRVRGRSAAGRALRQTQVLRKCAAPGPR
jgi:hypothetical protein